MPFRHIWALVRIRDIRYRSIHGAIEDQESVCDRILLLSRHDGTIQYVRDVLPASFQVDGLLDRLAFLLRVRHCLTYPSPQLHHPRIRHLSHNVPAVDLARFRTQHHRSEGG